MIAPGSYVAVPPPLVGREDAVRAVLRQAEARAGVVVVAGEPGAGATRVARAAADRLSAGGAAVLSAEAPGPALTRLQAALADAGHGPDPVRAARLRPLVVLLGDRDEPGLVETLRHRLAGSRALAILTGRAPSPDAPSVVLGRLPPDDAAVLARHAAPDLPDEAARAVAELGDGLPGRIVRLAAAARGWTGGDAPLPVPEAFRAWARRRFAPLDPWPAEVMRWAAVTGPAVDPAGLARVAGVAEAAVLPALAALERAGLLLAGTDPGPPRWRIADRLLAAAVLADMGAVERQRRHRAALRAGRARGDAPERLVHHAVAAGDPAAVVVLGAQAAARARGAGDAATALAHAERALRWCGATTPPERRLDALTQRGLALLDLSSFGEAANALSEAALGGARRGRREDALVAAAGAASALWSLGRQRDALDALRDHLDRDDGGGPASPARADALAQAAGMAVMSSRFLEAAGLAEAARREARAARAEEVAARALVFHGMARCGRGRPDGLDLLARAREEGRRGAGMRTETLASIYESHVLLLFGRPREAAARAGAGAGRARLLGIPDHALVLSGNLGEALAALGRLDEAGAQLERAASGWAELGVEAPSPADPGRAWVRFARGDVEGALEAFRGLGAMQGQGGDPPLLEQLAPSAAGHALAAAAAGHGEEAAAVVRAALDAWETTDDRLSALALLGAAGEAGEAADARRAAAALARIAAGGPPAARAFGRYAEGTLAVREGRDGVPALREAAAHFTALGMRWWAARAVARAGEAAGDAALLQEARGEMRDMGAEGWRRRIEGRLRAQGHRVATRSAPGAAGDLSGRELEVLTLLAEGLGNREIGARLYISERTVARHVGQILQKLGAANRTAAARTARARRLIAEAATPL